MDSRLVSGNNFEAVSNNVIAGLEVGGRQSEQIGRARRASSRRLILVCLGEKMR